MAQIVVNLADIWRDVGRRIGFFTKETRNQIPDQPGIYGWFLPLWLYREDLEGLLRLIETLHLYEPGTGGVARSDLEVELNWDSFAMSIQRQSAAKASTAKRDKWESALKHPEQRQTIQRALMEASIFMPPLYVGQTLDLRARYFQHVYGTRDGKNDFHRRFSDFAKQHDFPLSVGDLLFVSIETSHQDSSVLREFKLPELIEQVVMQICRPTFSVR